MKLNVQDRNLINKLNEGDKNSFNLLFRKYYPMLCAYIHRFLDLNESEEIAQDIFVWLWENHASIVIEYSVTAFLFKIAYRKALNKIKHKSVVQKNNLIYYESMKDTLTEMDFAQIDELTKVIQTSIENLPDSYRESFVLHRFKDMSYKEIATKLNISHKTVDYRIQQALKLLRAELKDYLPMLLTFYIIQI